MTALGSLLRRSEERSISKTDLWGQGADLDLPSYAGVTVNRDSAVRLVAVYACVRRVSETVASLPAGVFTRRGDARIEASKPPWVEQPNPETTWFEFVERVVSSLELDGNAYLLITNREGGRAAELFTLHPAEVEVRRESPGAPPIYIWGGSRRLTRFSPATPNGELLHIKNFSNGGLKGLNPIDVAQQAIGLGLATEEFGARFFGQGQTLSGVIQLPAAEPSKSQAYIDLIKANWDKGHGGVKRSHLPGVLAGGAEWKPISISPENAQFLETRRFQVEEIARLFNVPLFMIQDTTKNTSWGSGIEQMSIGFVQFSIDPRLVRLEGYLNQLLPRGQFIKWNTKGLLRGDIRTQSESFAKGRQWGEMTPNDIKRLNDDAPIEGAYGDSYLVPAGYQMVTADGEPVAAPEPPPEPVVPPMPEPTTPEPAPEGGPDGP